MSLSLANKSVTYPLGILENLPTKVGKFVIPADFVILEMEEDLEIPILFGRPFLRTVGVILDMKNGKITLEVDNESMEFEVWNMVKSIPIEVASRVDSIDAYNIIDWCIEEVIHECIKSDSTELNQVYKPNEQVMEISPYQPFKSISRFESLRREDDPEATATSEKVELDLKPLPSNLRYAFLESDSKYPFIVNSSLPNDCVDALCDKLNSHKNDIDYSINDLKGISPKI